MNICVADSEPTIVFSALDTGGNFFELEFLIDTGYTGSILLSVNKNWDVFKFLDTTPLVLLPKENWISLANDLKVKTYSSKITLSIHEISYTLPLTIIESKAEEFTAPLLGMKFLDFMSSHLSLDFKNNKFFLA
jgi:predicted aspartyl protease